MGMSPRKYNRLPAWCCTAVALALALGSCLSPPEYPVEPVLTFEGISKDTMVQDPLGVADTTVVVLSFTDGDGDLTFAAEDTIPNVFVINVETGEEVAQFKLDPIDEVGVENGISGELRLLVKTTCCDYPVFVNAVPCQPSNEYPIDTLLTEAYVVDRAGNESNRVQIAPIYLRCDNF